MVSVRLNAELEERLAAAVARTGRTKSDIARAAIEEKIGEFENIATAEEALRKR